MSDYYQVDIKIEFTAISTLVSKSIKNTTLYTATSAQPAKTIFPEGKITSAYVTITSDSDASSETKIILLIYKFRHVF